MNAALFMLTSAWMAGAEAAPVAAAPAPAVVSTGSSCGASCGGCATACDDPCCGKPGFFSRFKGRFAKGCCDTAPACGPVCAPAPVCCAPAPIVHCKPAPVCCAPAPVCCKPAPVCCKPAPTCGGCATACEDPCCKPSLFARLKGRFGKHGCEPCCDTGCATGSCGAPGPIAPGAHPEVIPAPKDKKEMPKGGVTGIQIEPVVTPVVAPRPPIEIGGASNPF